ncbi:muscarinic acetylcholine receptor M4 [Lingula anatina]|uniref:Muscarinic acetylcholine receptor M4 n=1 Tax=Lingula anatina TaxID=7574 RepID=A0A1S3HMP0_LINAN|nr:muscarinic acetylcholine receptor M4 [Lingula anatina]|eukprot:XP_013386324.1 muscarinic acetylcholine receptor M4 [Lingula anatina]
MNVTTPTTLPLTTPYTFGVPLVPSVAAMSPAERNELAPYTFNDDSPIPRLPEYVNDNLTEERALTEYYCNGTFDLSLCLEILGLAENLTFNYTSNETTTFEWTLRHPMWLTVLLAIFGGIVSIVTVLGNSLVLLSFYLDRQIRQPSNYFIASLAVSDLLIGLFSMPLYTMYLLLDAKWPLGPTVCDLWLSLDYTSCLASQYTVFFITVDRFCSVKIPAKYRNWRTEHKVNVMVSVTWVIPILIFYTSIIGWQYFVGLRTVPAQECWVQFMSSPMFNTILVIGYYWITLVVMIILYAGIYKVALDLHRKSAAKQKKMTSLVSMAGQTMTNIGIGISQTKKASVKEVKETISPLKNKKATAAVEEEEGSSSTAYPSDVEDSSSQSAPHPPPAYNSLDGDSAGTPVNKPKQHHHHHHHRHHHHHHGKDHAHGHKNKKTDDHLTTPKGEQYLTTPTPVSQTPSSLLDNESSTQTAGSHDTSGSSGETPKRGHGIRFIDQESFQSFASGEDVKLVVETRHIDKLAQSNDEPPSPIWKRRQSFKAKETEHSAANMVGCNGDKDKVCMQVSVNSKSKGKPVIKTIKPPSGNHEHKSARERVTQQWHDITTYFRRKNQKRKEKGKAQGKNKSKSENRARKALRTISLILGAFVLFWTPYHVIVIILGFCYDCVHIRLYEISYWFCYMNSPINPFCYAFANAQFKRTFKRILSGDLHRT